MIFFPFGFFACLFYAMSSAENSLQGNPSPHNHLATSCLWQNLSGASQHRRTSLFDWELSAIHSSSPIATAGLISHSTSCQKRTVYLSGSSFKAKISSVGHTHPHRYSVSSFGKNHAGLRAIDTSVKPASAYSCALAKYPVRKIRLEPFNAAPPFLAIFQHLKELLCGIPPLRVVHPFVIPRILWVPFHRSR